MLIRIQRKCLVFGTGLLFCSAVILILLLNLTSDDINPHFKYPSQIDNSHYSLRALKNGPRSRANLITKDGLTDDYDSIETEHDEDIANDGHDNKDLKLKQSSIRQSSKNNLASKYSPVPCIAFEDVTLTCLRDNSYSATSGFNDFLDTDKSSSDSKETSNQVKSHSPSFSSSLFVPLRFLHDYYEIQSRQIKLSNGQDAIQLVNSLGKIYNPTKPYSHRGPYLWFDKFNVQMRDRVKYLSGLWSVPLSTQWEPRGHYYPIQIAQFGLSHFSKSFLINSTQTSRPQQSIELVGSETVQESGTPTRWMYRKLSDSTLKLLDNRQEVLLDGLIDGLIDDHQAISAQMLVGRLKPEANFSITCVITCPDGSQFSLVYLASNDIAMRADLKHKRIVYGIGLEGDDWKVLIRDLANDLNKGLAPLGRRKLQTFQPVKYVRLMRMTIRGRALVQSLKLQESADVEYFQAAAHWLMVHQDKLLSLHDDQIGGGWAIRVGRRLGDNTGLVLRPPWYSAMAQGHGMSLLTRMYSVTGNVSYLESALRASYLFDQDASHGGVRTHFMDRHVWYEEYPTSPTSTYVLNGFIYSLFGLYDTQKACEDFKLHNTSKLSQALDNQCSRVGAMWEEGLDSLKAMLVLYDTGSGSVYDLRHVPLGLPPNVARWDYHTTHINQLFALSSMLADKDEKAAKLFKRTAVRWAGYMRKGERASHN